MALSTTQPQVTPAQMHGTIWKAWVAAFLAALFVYAATASRGVQWQDSGERILRVVMQEASSPLGLALNHPLHHYLGRVFVWAGGLEPALAVTLVSALGGALAVANVLGCVWTLTGRWGPAVFAAASLGVAHTFWQLSTITEVYTLSAALLAGECWCLAAYAQVCGRDAHGQHRRDAGATPHRQDAGATPHRRDAGATLGRRDAGATPYLLALLLLNGLGVANHLQAGLTTPVIAVVVLAALRAGRVSLRDMGIGALLWLAGASMYLGQIGAELAATGDLPATIRSALFGTHYGSQVLNTGVTLRLLIIALGFPLLNFPNLLLPAAFYGILRGRAVGVPALARRALAAMLIIHAAFALRYDVVDQHMFFLPMYVLLCTFGGVGAGAVMRCDRRQARRAAVAAGMLLVMTPLTYAITARAARRLDLLRSVTHNKPYRDDYTYLLIPWSAAERSAEIMSIEALRLAQPDGLILIEDPMAEFAIRYQAVRAGWTRLEIVPTPRGAESAARVSALIDSAVQTDRTVVLVPLDADSPRVTAPIGRWVRHGDLHRLDPGGADSPPLSDPPA